MATIFQAPSQQMQQQIPQQMPQVIPQQVQQQSQTEDPLFQALAKYITSGPGPSSTTTEAVQEIIDSYSKQTDGREYIESIVNPLPEIDVRLWPNEGDAVGTLSTTMLSLSLNFRAPRKYGPGEGGIPLVIYFDGDAPGLFSSQVVKFKE